MAMTTERKRTIEARLDRLRSRVQGAKAFDSTADLAGATMGVLDLLRDVLLENEPAPAMTAERAEELTKRAT